MVQCPILWYKETFTFRNTTWSIKKRTPKQKQKEKLKPWTKNQEFRKKSFKFYQKPQDAPTWRSNHLWCSLRGSPRRTCSTESPRKLRRRRTLSQRCSDRASTPSPTSHSSRYGKWVCWKLLFLSNWWWWRGPLLAKRRRRARRRRGKPLPRTWMDGDRSQRRVKRRRRRRMCCWETLEVKSEHLCCVVDTTYCKVTQHTEQRESFFFFWNLEFGFGQIFRLGLLG